MAVIRYKLKIVHATKYTKDLHETKIRNFKEKHKKCDTDKVLEHTETLPSLPNTDRYNSILSRLPHALDIFYVRNMFRLSVFFGVHSIFRFWFHGACEPFSVLFVKNIKVYQDFRNGTKLGSCGTIHTKRAFQQCDVCTPTILEIRVV
jgi:hypothetical protein